MSYEPVDSQALLLRGLLATDEHHELYRTSATFKATMDLIVSLLPLWVGGIAENAVKADEAQREAVEIMKRSLSVPFIIPEGAALDGWISGEATTEPGRPDG